MASIDKQLANRFPIVNAYTNFKKTGEAKMTAGACVARMQRLKDLWLKFESNHADLLDDADVDTSDNYFTTDMFSQVEEAYLNNLGMFQDFLYNLKTSQPSATGSAQPSLTAESYELNQAKLPTIVLPSFSGDIHEWVRFRDTFSEMVLKRPNLPNIYKMHHLRSSLKGEAAELLDEIPPAGEHFEDAWSTIKSFYDNPSLLINRLVNKLLSFNAMSTNTAHEITRVRTGVQNLLKALKSLGSPVDSWDHITVTLTVSKLTSRLQAKWAETVSKRDDLTVHPTFEELDKFLVTERISLTHLESAKSSSTASNRETKDNFSVSRKNVKSVHLVQQPKSNSPSCPICKETHFVGECSTLRSKSPAERKRLVTTKHICYNCLGNHLIQKCKSLNRCRTCSGKHHSLLHVNYTAGSPNTPRNNNVSDPSNIETSKVITNDTITNSTNRVVALSSNNYKDSGSVLLATAWVHAYSDSGNMQIARVLIDQGAQSSFISDDLCQLLRLRRRSVRVPISGVGNEHRFVCKSEVTFTIAPHFESSFTCIVTALVIPRITSYNPLLDRSKDWTHLHNLNLADPRFNQADKIDILLGAQVHANIIEQGLRKGDSADAPIAMQTLLGWVISGATAPSPHNGRAVFTANIHVDNVDLNDLLRRFWEIEESPHRNQFFTEDEVLCEEYYRNTVRRNSEGRYVVRLPLKPDFPRTWVGSHSLACKMLKNLERKFQTDPKLHTAYSQCIQEYLDLGHMRRVSITDDNVDRCYFLPHHGVIKESSSTTRLRTVFNASARVKGGKSLNNFLFVGPNLLAEIIDLLTNWRLYPWVFSADIEKMFRQILVEDDDQHLQAIVWRGGGSQRQSRPFA